MGHARMSFLVNACRSVRPSRSAALLRPLRLAREQSTTAGGTVASSSVRPSFDPLCPGVPTTDDCIPLKPPYSLESLITPAAPLPEPTLRKLHRLASLPYPSSVTAASLQGLISVVDGIRSERVRELLDQGEAITGNADSLGWGKKVIVFDGEREFELVDEAAADVAETGVEAHGRELLKDARKTAGGVYYTVQSSKLS